MSLKPSARYLRSSANLLQACALIARYAGKASLGKFRYREPHQRLRYFTRNVGRYTGKALNLFNFDIEVFGFDAELMKRRNFLMVSNHMSYIDILVLSSVQPCVFVTSVDLGETSFLGPMAEMGGSIFVERRHRRSIERDVSVMANTLRAGHNVVVYPEGTSSNGERILPFKKALLNSAIEAGVDILPVVIKYKALNDEPFSLKNRDRLCWYGDMSFFPHFLGLMDVEKVQVELHFKEPIPVRPESTRHELADQCYKVISETYGDPLGVTTFQDSRPLEL